MTVAVAERRITPEELLSLPDGEHMELVDGELVEKPMGTESGWVGGELFGLLREFNQRQRLGWVLPGEASYRCFPDDPARVRRPDVSFIRRGRLPGERLPTGHTPIAPDLAAEVVSPNDVFYEVRRKVREYLAAGVEIVWVLDPDGRTAEVWRREGALSLLPEEGILEGEAVLPGFRCRVGDLFPPAPPVEARADPGGPPD